MCWLVRQVGRKIRVLIYRAAPIIYILQTVVFSSGWCGGRLGSDEGQVLSDEVLELAVSGAFGGGGLGRLAPFLVSGLLPVTDGEVCHAGALVDSVGLAGVDKTLTGGVEEDARHAVSYVVVVGCFVLGCLGPALTDDAVLEVSAVVDGGVVGGKDCVDLFLEGGGDISEVGRKLLVGRGVVEDALTGVGGDALDRGGDPREGIAEGGDGGADGGLGPVVTGSEDGAVLRLGGGAAELDDYGADGGVLTLEEDCSPVVEEEGTVLGGRLWRCQVWGEGVARLLIRRFGVFGRGGRDVANVNEVG